jgi:hypothetical protein
MEEVKIEMFPPYRGDYIQLPESYAIGGWTTTAPKNPNITPQRILIVIRKEDGLEISLFSNRLKAEGALLFVSKSHLARQIKQAETWTQGAGSN